MCLTYSFLGNKLAEKKKTVDYFLVESAKSSLITVGISTFVQPVGAGFIERAPFGKHEITDFV